MILGAAVSGTAAARLARRRSLEVEVYDRDPVPLAPLVEEGFVVHSGDWNSSLLEGVDFVVTSPGFPRHGGPITDTLAAGLPLWSELEFAARELQCPYAAVTGTNGKTTTTEAAANMLLASGMKAIAAGNIGTALSDIVDESWDAVVIEASSFQLQFIDTFSPAAAAVLNIAPDHLDWHGDMTAYAAAKMRIAENQKPGDLLVYDADDPVAAEAASRLDRAIPISGTTRAAGGGPEGDVLWVGDVAVPRPSLGGAFLADLVAAGRLAMHLGADAAGVAEAIAGFRQGPHRRSVVGTWDGVTWVDDSKATNPHAALAAIAAYPSVVLIAGGRNKGLDLEGLVTAPNVRGVVAIGEAAAELVAIAGGPVSGHVAPVTTAASMEEAVAVAEALSERGDTVLLAPGCASFDMYSSYAERGTVFASAVHDLKEPT